MRFHLAANRGYPGLVTATLVFAVMISSASIQAQAQSQPRYEPWQDPAKQAVSNMQSIVDELNTLIDEAERSRAASPLFLRDLRDLARKYDNPWRRELLSDDFSDGDFTANPRWMVTAGKFRIEPGFGLRGSFDAAATQSEQQRRPTNEEVAVQILGGLLGQALGGGQTNSQGNTTQSGGSTEQSRQAAIHVTAPISNAFSAELELTSWRQERGTLALSTYQGSARQAGYRLIYRSGATPSMSLQRYSTRGVTDLGTTATTIALEDKKPHTLTWTRDALGNMSIGVDGREVIRAEDRGFRDAFDGIELRNTEGDYIIRRIVVNGS